MYDRLIAKMRTTHTQPFCVTIESQPQKDCMEHSCYKPVILHIYIYLSRLGHRETRGESVKWKRNWEKSKILKKKNFEQL